METKYLNERGKMFLQSNRLADCDFYFPESNTHLKANKLLLALASPIMDTMFFSHSNFVETKTRAVEILDIDVDVFEKFLLWIYAKELHFERMEDAVAVYQIANKYEVIDLELICEQYIIANVTLDNVCLAWMFGDFYNRTAIKDKALKMIRRRTTEVLDSPNFLQSNVDLLMAILNQDELWIKDEMTLFDVLEKFANRNSLAGNALDAAVKCIRFKIIDAEDLIRFKSILLSNEEKQAIVEHIKLENVAVKYPEGFSLSTISRCTDYVQIRECDQRFLKCVKDLHYSGEETDNHDDRISEGTIADLILMFIDIESHTHLKIVSVLRTHLPRENNEDNNVYLTRIFEDNDPRIIAELIACLKYFCFPCFLEIEDYEYGD